MKMSTINQEGFYKGVIVSGGFSVTGSGLPRSIWMLKASEVYDPEGQEYLPADSEADEITAYLCMFNHDGKENFNNPRIKKITGWDGGDFNDLSEMDLEGVELSFRVEYGTKEYADKLGVNGVDVPDASPTRSVTKLDKAAIDVLQAKYAGGLAKTKAPAKAVSAKWKGAAAKSKGKGAATKPTGRPTAPKPTAKTDAVVGKCTCQEAYNECFALSGSEGGDELEKAMNKVWTEEAAAVNVDEAKITDEEWFEIKGRVVKRTSKV
jgi:hypothetical protein